jgi:hypothetical protein
MEDEGRKKEANRRMDQETQPCGADIFRGLFPQIHACIRKKR